MAIGMLIEFPGMTVEQSDKVIASLNLNGAPPPGQLFHIDGPMEGGVRVVDVWESREVFERFVQEKLLPAFQQAGVQGPPPEPVIWPAQHILK